MAEPDLYYDSSFVMGVQRAEIVSWLRTLHPIWEHRYTTKRPLGGALRQRELKRPVYWLGNWQFACLNYYHPPHGTKDRCVTAEEFPPCLRRLVEKTEKIVYQRFRKASIPRGWHLNTCLVNFYGTKHLNGETIDSARVGEHKDFEPGPVASISLGERALFQFVSSRGHGTQSRVVLQQWLEDSSLQIFGGDKFKDKLFHRVQRVEDRKVSDLGLHIDKFETRRINFTFRYVPDRDFVALSDLPSRAFRDVEDYVVELSQHSDFWNRALRSATQLS